MTDIQFTGGLFKTTSPLMKQDFAPISFSLLTKELSTHIIKGIIKTYTNEYSTRTRYLLTKDIDNSYSIVTDYESKINKLHEVFENIREEMVQDLTNNYVIVQDAVDRSIFIVPKSLIVSDEVSIKKAIRNMNTHINKRIKAEKEKIKKLQSLKTLIRDTMNNSEDTIMSDKYENLNNTLRKSTYRNWIGYTYKV